MIWDSSVGIGTGYGLDVREFDFRQGQETFLYSTAFRPARELTQPPTQWIPGAISLEVKRPGREAGHSPPSSAEVKNGGAILTFPQTSS
jgi:hypothetical protein